MTKVPPGGEAGPDEAPVDSDEGWPPAGWVEVYDGRTPSRTRLVRVGEATVEDLPTAEDVRQNGQLVRDMLRDNVAAEGGTGG